MFKVVSVPGADALTRPPPSSRMIGRVQLVAMLTMPSPLSDGDVLNTLDGL